IAAYEAALTVFTREALPREWVDTQTKLAGAYWKRAGDSEKVEKAIAAFEAALTVFTREALPREWATTQLNLGAAYHARTRGDRADNLEKTIAAYERVLMVRTREASPRDHLVFAMALGAVLLEARKWREAGAVYASARDTFLLLFGE